MSITADDQMAPYDGATYDDGFSVTYSGFVNGEDENVLTGTQSYATVSSGAVVDALDAGSYVIRASGLESDNYDITWADGTLTINRTTTVNALCARRSRYQGGCRHAGGPEIDANAKPTTCRSASNDIAISTCCPALPAVRNAPRPLYGLAIPRKYGFMSERGNGHLDFSPCTPPPRNADALST